MTEKPLLDEIRDTLTQCEGTMLAVLDQFPHVDSARKLLLRIDATLARIERESMQPTDRGVKPP